MANLPSQCRDGANCADRKMGNFCRHEFVPDRGKTYFVTQNGVYKDFVQLLRELFQRECLRIQKEEISENPVKMIAKDIDLSLIHI